MVKVIDSTNSNNKSYKETQIDYALKTIICQLLIVSRSFIFDNF